MSKRRNLNIALVLAIFASILVIFALAAASYEHGGKPMAPGPVGEPAKKHLV